MKTEKNVFYVLEVPDPNCTRYIHYRSGGHIDDCWGDVMTAERFDTEDEAREEMVSLIHVHGIETEPRRVTVTVEID